MPLSVAIVLVAGGVVWLLMGGDMLVRGAVGLAHRARISPMVVGLTIVAMGTSAPELVVSLEAAYRGFPEIAIGNVVGSNIANVLLVVGMPAMLQPLVCSQPGARRDALFMLGVTALFVALCADSVLGRFDGGVLMVGLVLFLAIQFRSEVTLQRRLPGEGEVLLELGLPTRGWTIALLISSGVVMLPVGATLLIGGAVGLAELLGVSHQVIGLTVVALSTSVPELATMLVACYTRQADVAVGTVLGSNVLNILGIMGITSLVSPDGLAVPERFMSFEFPLMFFAAVLITGVTLRRGVVGRRLGAAMLSLYVAYTVLLYTVAA